MDGHVVLLFARDAQRARAPERDGVDARPRPRQLQVRARAELDAAALRREGVRERPRRPRLKGEAPPVQMDARRAQRAVRAEDPVRHLKRRRLRKLRAVAEEDDARPRLADRAVAAHRAVERRRTRAVELQRATLENDVVRVDALLLGAVDEHTTRLALRGEDDAPPLRDDDRARAQALGRDAQVGCVERDVRLQRARPVPRQRRARRNAHRLRKGRLEPHVVRRDEARRAGDRRVEDRRGVRVRPAEDERRARVRLERQRGGRGGVRRQPPREDEGLGRRRDVQRAVRPQVEDAGERRGDARRKQAGAAVVREDARPPALLVRREGAVERVVDDSAHEGPAPEVRLVRPPEAQLKVMPPGLERDVPPHGHPLGGGRGEDLLAVERERRRAAIGLREAVRPRLRHVPPRAVEGGAAVGGQKAAVARVVVRVEAAPRDGPRARRGHFREDAAQRHDARRAAREREASARREARRRDLHRARTGGERPLDAARTRCADERAGTRMLQRRARVEGAAKVHVLVRTRPQHAAGRRALHNAAAGRRDGVHRLGVPVQVEAGEEDVERAVRARHVGREQKAALPRPVRQHLVRAEHERKLGAGVVGTLEGSHARVARPVVRRVREDDGAGLVGDVEAARARHGPVDDEPGRGQIARREGAAARRHRHAARRCEDRLAERVLKDAAVQYDRVRHKGLRRRAEDAVSLDARPAAGREGQAARQALGVVKDDAPVRPRKHKSPRARERVRVEGEVRARDGHLRGV